MSAYVPFLQPQFFQPRSSGAGFAPTDIAGCKLWLDASQIVGLSDGDPVSTWEDASGNGNDATTDGADPIYKVNILNGHAVLRTNGASRLVGSIQDSSNWTIVAVYSQTSSGGGKRAVGTSTNSLIGPYGTLYQTYDGSFSGGSAINPGAFVIHVGVHASGVGANNYVNGVLDGGNNPTGGGQSLGTAYSVCAAGTEFIDGDMPEVIIYDSALGTTDRQTVEAYLATKYGL